MTRNRFNEPDLEGQAWMTVEECVEGWREHLEPFAKKGLKLVSPAVTNGRSSALTSCIDESYEWSFVCFHFLYRRGNSTDRL